MGMLTNARRKFISPVTSGPAPEMIQIEGCDHHWFENRGRPCTALVYVDDATSRLMHLLYKTTKLRRLIPILS